MPDRVRVRGHVVGRAGVEARRGQGMAEQSRSADTGVRHGETGRGRGVEHV